MLWKLLYFPYVQAAAVGCVCVYAYKHTTLLNIYRCGILNEQTILTGMKNRVGITEQAAATTKENSHTAVSMRASAANTTIRFMIRKQFFFLLVMEVCLKCMFLKKVY